MLHAIQAWAEANPLAMTLIVWPLLTAILTAVLKPRTTEAYAALAARDPVWLFARFAALLQLIGALGLDPVKAIRALAKVVSGKAEIVVVVAVCAVAAACTPGARFNALELLAKKVECALANQDLPNDQIVARCALQPGDIEQVLSIVEKSRVRQSVVRASACRDGGQ